MSALTPQVRSILAVREVVSRPARTRAQRRRRARDLWVLMRRGRHGWESSDYAASDKACVAYDSAGALKALRERLAAVGMQLIEPKPKRRRAHL